MSAFSALTQLWRERRCRACTRPYIPETAVAKVTKLPELAGLADLLCPVCAGQLTPYTGTACRLCCLPLPLSVPKQPEAHALCGGCLHKSPPWEVLYSYALYEGLLKRLLLRCKFGHDNALLPLLGHILALGATHCLPCHIVVPVPQHPVRLRERGCNQAHELARCVARTLALPLRANALTRIRYTPPQTRLSADARHHNPKNSFAAHDVQGLTVLLLDDTMTTGATLRHASATLRAAGAQAVRVAVLARAALHKPAAQKT